MLKPRNTLVTVAPVTKGEKKVGNLIVPDETSKEYEQCEVVEVGPGMLEHEGDQAQTHDLKPGQRVLVHNHARRGDGRLQRIGVGFKTNDHRDLILVEQSQIVAIIEDDEPQQPNLKLSD
jgi:co-chaperonin GroES (HSP10)